MAYVLDGNNKYNIIWGKYFNKWQILINNTLCMEYERNMIELLMIWVMIYIPYMSYKEWQSMSGRIDTILYYHICSVKQCMP